MKKYRQTARESGSYGGVKSAGNGMNPVPAENLLLFGINAIVSHETCISKKITWI